MSEFRSGDRVHPQVPTSSEGIPGCPGILQGLWPSGNLACHSGCIVVLSSGAVETMPGVAMSEVSAR